MSSSILASFLLVLVNPFTSLTFGEMLETPEQVIRALVKANAEKDMKTLSRYMAHDAGTIGYTIGGRKYVGWESFKKEMQHEFDAVARLEIPITDLQIWTRGDVAWFAMELDYIRYVGSGDHLTPTTLELRETGVVERRNGQWVLVTWHESLRSTPLSAILAARPQEQEAEIKNSGEQTPDAFDLSGTWYIEEEDTTYTATLDKNGNGTYTHKNGRYKTIQFKDRKLLGTWHQSENDREGGFEVLFSEDGNEARGIWWYTRVGSQDNIPPREHGGTYYWKRETPGLNHQGNKP